MRSYGYKVMIFRSVYYKTNEVQDFNQRFHGNTMLLYDKQYYHEFNATGMNQFGVKIKEL
jgi:hypothetical protein